MSIFTVFVCSPFSRLFYLLPWQLKGLFIEPFLEPSFISTLTDISNFKLIPPLSFYYSFFFFYFFGVFSFFSSSSYFLFFSFFSFSFSFFSPFSYFSFFYLAFLYFFGFSYLSYLLLVAICYIFSYFYFLSFFYLFYSPSSSDDTLISYIFYPSAYFSFFYSSAIFGFLPRFFPFFFFNRDPFFRPLFPGYESVSSKSLSNSSLPELLCSYYPSSSSSSSGKSRFPPKYLAFSSQKLSILTLPLIKSFILVPLFSLNFILLMAASIYSDELRSSLISASRLMLS